MTLDDLKNPFWWWAHLYSLVPLSRILLKTAHFCFLQLLIGTVVWVLTFAWILCITKFLRVTITKDHKLCGLKHQCFKKFILSPIWRPGNLKSSCQQGWFPPEAEGEVLCCFLRFLGLLATVDFLCLIDACVCVSAKSLSHVQLCATLWTVACQAPLSVGILQQEYWSGLPCSTPGDLPDLGIEPMSPVLQADSLPLVPPGKPAMTYIGRESRKEWM